MINPYYTQQVRLTFLIPRAQMELIKFPVKSLCSTGFQAKRSQRVSQESRKWKAIGQQHLLYTEECRNVIGKLVSCMQPAKGCFHAKCRCLEV